MVLVGFFCVLGAVGLLVVGLVQTDPDLVWASIGASAVGGLAVAVASIQRSRALRGVRAGARATPARSVREKPPAPQEAAVEKPVAKKKSQPQESVAAKERAPEKAVADESVTKEARSEEALPSGSAPDAVTQAASEAPPQAGAEADPVPEDRLDDAEAVDPADEPGEEDVDMADLLVVIDLPDEVLVIDLRPRYHLPGCVHLENREAIPLPVNEARADGFTPCGLCRPDAALAAAARQARVRSAEPPARARPRPGP